MRTPFSLLAERWHPSAALVRRAALSAVVMSVVIVVTGGAVRLTGSGLGCDTWPTCTPQSLTPTPAMGLHGIIEFTNRMLTYVLCAAVGWTILAARCATPWRRSLTRMGWAQFWVVMSNAVLGGITVLTGLNPYLVAAHLIAAMALVWIAVVTWERAKEGDGPVRPAVARPLTQLAYVLVGVTGLLVAAGTLVTGAGHHPGDSSDVPRIALNYDRLAQLHADFAFITIGLSLAVIFVLAAVKAPAAARARSHELFVVLLAQGVLGFVQYFTDVPELLVGVHMLGASLTWIAAVRIPLALRTRGDGLDSDEPPAALPAQTPQQVAAV
ncbi:cytochrome c oxidase assembly protein subunit 15 [Kitasatospora sp. MAP12-15]|uniref:COX15/CtaA family protein n=1 Tax=unclassified Kitasatospora TaxID=2633591 RepID=UPI0024767179|nr:COX15/CtaA family protein [Kitasatospora sp. MAP12-44]MDH6113337.1 cytochrome c oxidase assembly protein subunit 15 [Kitasatospora sp. MAP12-44]